MKLAVCVAVVCLLSMQRAATETQPSGPQIPILTTPDGTAPLAKGGHGYAGGRTRSYEFQLTTELSSAEVHYRLAAGTTVPAIATHYVDQLAKVGWTVNFTRLDPKLAHARFSVGAAFETVTGTLTVVPLQAPAGVMVSCRLVRANAPWRDGSRAGGAGANARSPTLAFGGLTGPLQFPTDVVKAEMRSSSSGPDYEYVEMRLQTPSAPSPLMAHLQGQLPKDGWTVDARAGDAGHESVLRRNTAGDVVELWQLTALAVTRETDALLTVIRSRR